MRTFTTIDVNFADADKYYGRATKSPKSKQKHEVGAAVVANGTRGTVKAFYPEGKGTYRVEHHEGQHVGTQKLHPAVQIHRDPDGKFA